MTKHYLDYSIYIKKRKEYLFTSSLNLDYAKSLFPNYIIKNLNQLDSFLKKSKAKKVKLDFSGSSVYFYKKLLSYGFDLEDFDLELKKRRMIKNKQEVGFIKKANKIAFDILNSLEIKKGIKEKEILKQLKIEAVNRGVELSFPPIIADLSNARFPHYQTGDKRIKKGVLIDFGVKYKEYCSDITEVVFLEKGKEVFIYEKLKEIFFDLVDHIKESKSSLELHKRALYLYKKHKLRFPPHSIGHGIGLEVHEPPYFSDKFDYDLENTTIALEPSYYSSYGLRFERNLFISSKGAKILA